MKNDCESLPRPSSPKFAKTAREWILASALYDGIEDEDIRQIEMLVSERGANPNVLLPEYGISPFHLVVANESTRFAVQATDLCLQHGADPNVRSEDGLTPVHLAAMWGCAEVLHLLLASGGDPWLVDELGLNAFDYATRESQHKCYQILKTCCTSQPKSSGCQKSPYQLNLKRVILYKNDLQIVYEASPTSLQKTTSTQTSPSAQKQIIAQGTPDSLPQRKITSNSHGKDLCTPCGPMTKINNSPNNYETPVNTKLKEIIEKHRRNSMLFEYSPPLEGRHGISSAVDSCTNTSKSEAVMIGFSELVNKLNESNKIRQSLKANDNSTGNDLLKNITQRKMPCSSPKPFTAPKRSLSSISEKSIFCDKSSQYEVPPNEIGFVLNNSDANASLTEYASQRASSSNESPPSIGFILDNLSDMCNGQDSSLFSDIGSDVEAFATPVHNDNVETNMTEDEKSPKVVIECSSNDSLSPYVSCENTRGRESNEEFVSCRDSESFVARVKNKKEPPAIVDALNDYFEKHSVTSMNPEVITSTPEKSEIIEDSQNNGTDVQFGTNVNVTTERRKGLSAGSDEDSFLSANAQPAAKKLSWVQATVASSSDEEPYMSISEEYEYTDLDEGVVLIEKRYLTKDVSMTASESVKKATVRESSSSECESVSTLSGSEGAYDTDELRRALVHHGFAPGPITGSTKRVYLRKLKRYRKKPPAAPVLDSSTPAFSSELLKTLSQPCEHLLGEWSHLEDSMSASFSCARRPWREGQAKTSFTYLLLDPRIARSLPTRAAAAPALAHTLWAEFLRGVFYVGKGKRSRPYAHLNQAVFTWQQNKDMKNCKKIQRILDIWKAGEGVICLHVFLNVIPVEAFTREAAMICAITLLHLTNEQAGKFYGSAASWSERLRRRLGCVLLHRAFKVFLAEGERQLRPADIE